MELSGKRLLILGGAYVHCNVVRRAKEMGIYTIVADNLIDSPAKLIADEKLFISILDVDAIVDWCRKNPVDGVINYANDPVQKAHQQICEKLGLPCYGTYEQTAILSDKILFSQLCEKNGVSTIPSYCEDDVVSGKLSDEDYPILVKPADSRGSKGQVICGNYQEAIDGIEFSRSQSFTGNIIIQKYMDRYDDLQLSYLVIDGEPILIKVEDRYLGSKENGFDRLAIATVFPSLHTKEYTEKSDYKIRSMIKSIGLKNAPVFLQGFWVNDDIVLYDPGIRFPGDNFDSGYSRSSSISVVELMIIYALSGRFPDNTAERLKKVSCEKFVVMLMPCLRPGMVGRTEGIDEIQKEPYIVDSYISVKKGDTVTGTGNCNQRLGEFVLLAENIELMKERISWLFSKLRVYDSLGNDMIIEQFEPSLIN